MNPIFVLLASVKRLSKKFSVRFRRGRIFISTIAHIYTIASVTGIDKRLLIISGGSISFFNEALVLKASKCFDG